MIGALVISADTRWTSRRGLDTPAHQREFVRPAPAASPYLDSAVEPAPWSQRDGPRPPIGGRPALPGERPGSRRSRSRTGNPLRPSH
ncbi:hypothetical protein AB0E59_17590 [Lentzea sp. NPDC034063]|uniref:hypothetical protein n=1 Tax=unclassified Lentzea TaxID=2643253 RepID=UPI0033CD885E